MSLMLYLQWDVIKITSVLCHNFFAFFCIINSMFINYRLCTVCRLFKKSSWNALNFTRFSITFNFTVHCAWLISSCSIHQVSLHSEVMETNLINLLLFACVPRLPSLDVHIFFHMCLCDMFFTDQM